MALWAVATASTGGRAGVQTAGLHTLASAGWHWCCSWRLVPAAASWARPISSLYIRYTSVLVPIGHTAWPPINQSISRTKGNREGKQKGGKRDDIEKLKRNKREKEERKTITARFARYFGI